MSLTSITIQLGPYPLFAIAGGCGVLHLTFAQKRHENAMSTLAPLDEEPDSRGQEVLMALAEQIQEYSSGQRALFEVVVDPQYLAMGTPFQRRVWELLNGIPYGKVHTYGEIATQLGNRNLSRAVGQACHNNPLALIIPCHRVVGKSGLCGFAGGVSLKEYLLTMEGSYGSVKVNQYEARQ